MGMAKSWQDLPNAALIDRVLEDLRLRPRAWDEARAAAWEEVWAAELDAAWYVSLGAADAAFRYGILDAVREAARDRPWAASHNLAREAAWGAIVALIAWDHAGSYLDLPRDQVQTLAALGDKIAILLLPAVIALESQREMA